MSRWFDCPDCIGYCEEYICPNTGSSICDWCGQEVTFKEAPESLKRRLYKARLWCEEIAVVKVEEDEDKWAPAFNSQAEYDRYIQWNAIRMGAACDQLISLLSDDSNGGKPPFTVGEYTLCVTTDEEFEKLPDAFQRVDAEHGGSGSVTFVWHEQTYTITDQGLAAITAACEKGEIIALDLLKNGTGVAVVFVMGKK
jgi:hypothetical protein